MRITITDDNTSRLRLGLGPVSEPQHLSTGPIEVSMILTDTQQVTLGPLTFTDRKGNRASVQAGSVMWASSDPAVVAVTPSADGLSATAVAGQTGTATVTVTADADLSDGVTTISGHLDFEVQGGQAATLSIPTGTPTEQA